MATYSVHLTEGAEKDIEEIYRFVEQRDGQDVAGVLLEDLMEASQSLHCSPDRGSYPKELLALGIKEYRQLLFGTYRMIYRVHDYRVIVYLISHQRRDYQSLLEARVLR